MASVHEQLNALRDLCWLCLQAKLLGFPRRFEYIGADVERCKNELRQLKREMVQAQIELSNRVHEAQKRLLSTGCAVPDSWLTVRVVGQLAYKHTAADGKKPETAVLSDSGADIEALETVCDEMRAAILRLEAQSDGCLHDGGLPTTGNLIKQSNLPVTLTDFIKIYCETGDKISVTRLDSLKTSLQNAVRRKGAAITLPKHIGAWKPGQKKYYEPSQLRKAWPGLKKHLPFLPPLRETKS